MSKNIEVKIKRTADVSTLRGQPIPKDKQFSEIIPLYSNAKGTRHDSGVLDTLDIYELRDYINNYGQGKKKDANGFLKGIYKGGTSSNFCIRNSDYLFYDIDIKETNDNVELFRDQAQRQKLLHELRKYSVLLGRSNSGIGIFGVFHVKDLLRVKDNLDHKFIAEHIYRYLSVKFLEKGINVQFDNAQGKYRQVRFVAWQKDKIEINDKPLTFTYELKKEELEISKGAPDFQYEGGHIRTGSIRDKFNQDNPLDGLLPEAGLSLVSGNRYKYHLSTSSTSGELKDGQYINNSSTFSSRTYFDAFAMAAHIKGFSFKDMYRHLFEKGYRDEEIKISEVAKDVKPELTARQIFEICYPLRYAGLQKKQEFLNSIDSDQIDLYRAYLNMKRLQITYDEVMTIDKWVSEVIEPIFQRADNKRKIIVASETGTGKSTAIIRNFRRLRPNKRLLFIVPLTAIADQLYDPLDPDMIMVKGGSPEAHFELAHEVSIVIATHKQAAKLLDHKSGFDYIVRDEIHSDIVGSSFRSDVISELNQNINTYGDIPSIGLTGTPLNIFKEKGLEFYLIKIDSGKAPNKVIQRTDNRHAYKPILQHQKGVSGKAFYRANSMESLKTVKRELIKEGYSSDEILILNASKEAKLSEPFSHLVEESKFNDEIKVVLTTSVIDEGVSIKNKDFTDIVFIDGSYHPRPEPLKQFLNRFRNAGDAKYYHYRKTPEQQDYRQYTSDYDEDSAILEDKIRDKDFFSYTKYKTFVSNDSFYHEKGDINYYYLAYKVTKHFFETLNNAEFNEFIETNYNIIFEEDFSYESKDVDVKRKTPAEIKTERTMLYNTHTDLVDAIVIFNTSDKTLQQEYSIPSKEDYESYPENLKKAVKDNLHYFEPLLSYKMQLGYILEEEYVDQFLRDKDKELDSKQVIIRKIQFLKNQRTLETNIHHERDKEARAALKEFLELVRSCREPPTKVEIDSFLDKVGAVDKPKP